MPIKTPSLTLADSLRKAILTSGISYSQLAKLARMSPGIISHFMLGQRDMTLGVASRLCAVLGYGLTQVAESVSEPLAAPASTSKSKGKGGKPASAHFRGQGRRVDLKSNGDAERTATDRVRFKEPSEDDDQETNEIALESASAGNQNQGKPMQKRKKRR